MLSITFGRRSFAVSGQEMEDRYNEHNLLAAVKRCVGPVEVVCLPAAGGEQTAVQVGAAVTSTTSGRKKEVTCLVPYFLRQCCTCLSVKAFCHVLCALSSALSKQLLEELVHKKTFTEWGAMLLYQEVSELGMWDGYVMYFLLLASLMLMRPLFQVTSACQYLESLVDSAADCRELKVCHEGLLLTLKVLLLEQPKDVTRYSIPARLLDEEGVRRILCRRCDFSKSDQDAIANVKINLIK